MVLNLFRNNFEIKIASLKGLDDIYLLDQMWFKEGISPNMQESSKKDSCPVFQTA